MYNWNRYNANESIQTANNKGPKKNEKGRTLINNHEEINLGSKE